MLRIIVPLQVLWMTLTDRKVTARDERGQVTLESVLICVGVLVVAGLLVAVITTYVKAHMAKIK